MALTHHSLGAVRQAVILLTLSILNAGMFHFKYNQLLQNSSFLEHVASMPEAWAPSSSTNQFK